MKWLIFPILAMALALPCLAADAQPLDKITNLEDLAITPIRTPPPVAYEGSSGSYSRTMTKPVDWFGLSTDPFAGITAFQGRDSASPSFNSAAYEIGQGQGGRITGGGVAEWKDAVRRGPTLLIIIGGLMLAAGIIVAVWAGRWVLGLAVAGAGLVLAMTGVLFEMYPWVVLVALAAVLGVGLWWLIDSKGLVKLKTALTAVVAAGEANPAIKTDVAVAAQSLGAETGIRETIRKVKVAPKTVMATKAATDAAKLKAAEAAAKP